MQQKLSDMLNIHPIKDFRSIIHANTPRFFKIKTQSRNPLRYTYSSSLESTSRSSSKHSIAKSFSSCLNIVSHSQSILSSFSFSSPYSSVDLHSSTARLNYSSKNSLNSLFNLIVTSSFQKLSHLLKDSCVTCYNIYAISAFGHMFAWKWCSKFFNKRIASHYLLLRTLIPSRNSYERDTPFLRQY